MSSGDVHLLNKLSSFNLSLISTSETVSNVSKYLTEEIIQGLMRESDMRNSFRKKYPI